MFVLLLQWELNRFVQRDKSIYWLGVFTSAYRSILKTLSNICDKTLTFHKKAWLCSNSKYITGILQLWGCFITWLETKSFAHKTVEVIVFCNMYCSLGFVSWFFTLRKVDFFLLKSWNPYFAICRGGHSV